MAKTDAFTILKHTTNVFANSGTAQFSIRSVAKQVPISPSVIYHYFSNEHTLLRAMFDQTNSELGKRRSQLSPTKSAKEMLRQRIEFQIDNQTEIVAVLKYYIAFRSTFSKFKNGFVPDKSALHIEEVLIYGLKTGEFNIQNIEDDAKVITHAINGFLLEYHPHIPQGIEKQELIDRIHSFIIRALVQPQPTTSTFA